LGGIRARIDVSGRGSFAGATGEKLLTIAIADSRITGVAFSTRGDRLAAIGYRPVGACQIWEWDVSERKPVGVSH